MAVPALYFVTQNLRDFTLLYYDENSIVRKSFAIYSIIYYNEIQTFGNWYERKISATY